MPGGLKNSTSVWKLARDLGIGATDDPIAAIIKFCDRRVKDVLKTFPDCGTLTELLDCVAAKLGTVFEIATTDEDLRQIQQKYMLKGERFLPRWIRSCRKTSLPSHTDVTTVNTGNWSSFP